MLQLTYYRMPRKKPLLYDAGEDIIVGDGRQCKRRVKALSLMRIYFNKIIFLTSTKPCPETDEGSPAINL